MVLAACPSMPSDPSLSASRFLDERQRDDDGDQAADIDDNVKQIGEGHRRRSVKSQYWGPHRLGIRTQPAAASPLAVGQDCLVRYSIFCADTPSSLGPHQFALHRKR